ncbi:MAG: tRNA guanosine(34) transglycosylase Tgt [Phycisphaerales bacterium]|nr:tRNA guanosine(34) transglycosylase Tgt [Phycisphaerales bacterium]MCB9836351.1 tRNA guanosine(34) transglycosylase Tgt [Phycisphaera sp.]
MSGPIRFEITHKCSRSDARVGKVATPHGTYDTPAFMTVGTRATVKGLYPSLLAQAGCGVLLGNTYHLLLRPGPEVVAELGGLHAMMGWNGPILTDSGGYQAYSMADLNAVDDDGVTFKSIIDGRSIRLGPEEATHTQNLLGADIIMAFDDCPPSVDPEAGPTNQTRIRLAARRDASKKGYYDHAQRVRASNERTVRWLERCKAAHKRPNEQALFGIVQGGTDLDERRWSAEHICNIDLPGYAIGGVAVGESPDEIDKVVEFTTPLLPAEKPRYLMGVGYERDILAAVLCGVDMFDCVLPTRNGRNANAFSRFGPMRLRNATYTRDREVIEPGCDCHACDPVRHGLQTVNGGGFSRGTIRHLFMAGEMLGPILVSLHNVRHFQRLMLDIRRAVREDDWLSFAERWPVAVTGLPTGLRDRLGL